MGCAGSTPMVASSYDAKPLQAQGNGHQHAVPDAKSDAEPAPPVTQPQQPEAEPPAPPTPPQAPPLPAATNGHQVPAAEPKLRKDIAKMTTEKEGIIEDEEEDSVAMGDLPMLPKKQRSSIRRATPQVQSMSASMKRTSRDKVTPSSRSSSISEAISE